MTSIDGPQTTQTTHASSARRYQGLDAIRAIALCNMIAYHALWDIVYVFGGQHPTLVDFFNAPATRFWQECIGFCFIALSGYCFPLGRHHGRQTCKLALSVLVIFLITLPLVSMQVVPIYIGVLSLILCGTLVLWAIESAQKPNLPSQTHPLLWAGATLTCMVLFAGTHDLALGYLFGQYVELVGSIAQHGNLVTAFIGIPGSGFNTFDYYPLLPWLCVMLAGYCLHHTITAISVIPALQSRMHVHAHPHKVELDAEQPIPNPLTEIFRFMTFMGRHSLMIYLTHQIVLFPLIWALSLVPPL